MKQSQANTWLQRCPHSSLYKQANNSCNKTQPITQKGRERGEREGREKEREMTILNTRPLIFVIAIEVIFIFLGSRAEAEACKGDVPTLAASCKDFVLKPIPQKDPSPECGQIIKKADVPCVCDVISKS